MKRKIFTPRDYQKLIIQHIHNVPKNAIWASMGLGKTVATLTAIDNLVFAGYESKPTLIVAPLRVAQSTWPDEAKKWEHLRNIEVQPIVGTVEERKAALRNRNANVFTTNYENIPWLVELYGKKWPFGKIVSDESTKLKGFRITQGTQRSHALGKILHNFPNRFTELTGTPSPNGLQDLWGQIWFLDRGMRLGKSFDAFEKRWFRRGYNGYGLEPFPFTQQQIEERLKDICLSLDAADYFDIEEPIVNIKYIDLPPKARMKYREMEKTMFTELQKILGGQKHEIEAFNAASRTQKCLQLANGAAYIEKSNTDWVEIHDLKLQALDEIIEEAAGMPVLVAYNFKSDLARLLKAFPKGRVLDKKPQTIRDWNAGKIKILFAHPASAGHGLNLQDGGNILAFFGHNWNLEEYLQIIERIGPVRQIQAGHNRPVFIHHIIARDTVDEDVLARLQTKKSVQDALLEAMKRKGIDA